MLKTDCDFGMSIENLEKIESKKGRGRSRKGLRLGLGLGLGLGF